MSLRSPDALLDQNASHFVAVAANAAAAGVPPVLLQQQQQEKKRAKYSQSCCLLLHTESRSDGDPDAVQATKIAQQQLLCCCSRCRYCFYSGSCRSPEAAAKHLLPVGAAANTAAVVVDRLPAVVLPALQRLHCNAEKNVHASKRRCTASTAAPLLLATAK